MDNGGCEHNCVSIGTSYYCTCNSGYELNSDGNTCQQGKQSLHDIVLPFHSYQFCILRKYCAPL